MSAAILLLAAQPIGQGGEFAVPWARIILSLLVCLALAVWAIAFIRRRAGAPPLTGFARFLAQAQRDEERELELIERLPLSAASQLCLVRCGERRFLLHVSAAGAQLVARLDDDTDGGAQA